MFTNNLQIIFQSTELFLFDHSFIGSDDSWLIVHITIYTKNFHCTIVSCNYKLLIVLFIKKKQLQEGNLRKLGISEGGVCGYLSN